MLKLDHVVYAVGDLDAAAARLLDEHGLDSVPGGEHTGFGTANRIVPLGETYLELLGVVDDGVATNNPMGQLLRSFETDRLMSWCVATDDIVERAGSIGSATVAMSRTTPDGKELTWRVAGVDGAFADPSLPFFIGWDMAAELHPGRDVARHRAKPTGITNLSLRGQPEEIEDRLGGETLPIVVERGDPPALLAVTIGTADGDIIIS